MKPLIHHGPGKMSREDATMHKLLHVTTVQSGKPKPKQPTTHQFQFALDGILNAYDNFDNAGREHALKVILTSK